MDSDLKKSFEEGNVQVFVGAGLSCGSYPGPDELKNILLQERVFVDGQETTLGKLLKDSGDVPLEDAAQFYEIYKQEDGLLEIIKKCYGEEKVDPTEIHRDLWKLPNVTTIYTTNFDCLIEDALGYPMKQPTVITGSSKIQSAEKRERVVFKLHGCARRSASRADFVITRNDYLDYAHTRRLDALRAIVDISTKTFLFLGYSLRDLNMRYIISEASRLSQSRMRSYAVLKDTSGPEARYWEKRRITLIQKDAAEFLASVFREFPIDEAEFTRKLDLRVDDKRKIASKALREIVRPACAKAAIDIVLDAGSSCLFFAEALFREFRDGTVPAAQVRIITNSPPIMRLTEESRRNIEGELELICIGGELKHYTQAIIPDEEAARQQLTASRRSGHKRIAFVGTTSIDEGGLKTRRRDEVAVKGLFIDTSDEVYILADHSKLRLLREGVRFLEGFPSKVRVITDRVAEMRKELSEVEWI